MKPAATLHPRHRIDIEPDALGRALAACAAPSPRALEDLEALADPGGEILAALSVRSAFDALLTALALPHGSEVLLSAWTIPDMARVVRAHGLVPVPVDCAARTLCPTPEAISAAITPRTRVAVIAQLFGAAADLAPFARVCAPRGVLLVDDDAQGFTGPARLQGSPAADVSFYSFGSIKTATALGGALARVRDATLRSRMRAAMRVWPAQPTGRYARKVATYLGLAAMRDPRRYAAFARALARSGRDLDAVMTGAVRSFPADTPDALLRAVRWRPCDALCATLRSAIAGFDGRRLARRRDAGERMRARLDGVEVLGDAMAQRTHWLFAVLVDAPDALVTALRREGFDAARGTSTIAALGAPPERPASHPRTCASWPARMVFLPVYPEVPEADRDRMAERVRAHAAQAGYNAREEDPP